MSTPTNTPTSKCCPDCPRMPCSDTCHYLKGKSGKCTPTTDSKNSSEDWEKEFRAKWEGANDYANDRAISTPLMDALIEDIRSQIQKAEARGRKDAVEFIRENYMKDGKSHYTTLAKVLEAALETPS